MHGLVAKTWSHWFGIQIVFPFLVLLS